MFQKTSILCVASALLAITGSQAHAGHYTYGSYHRPVVRYSNPLGIAPLHFQNDLPSVPAGSSLTLPANFLGEHPGSVFLVFGNVKLPVQVLNWSNDGVTITLPPMAIRHPVQVRLDVVLPHGQLGLQRQFLLTRPADVVLHPTGPMSPLPTSDAILSQQPEVQ
jgi:hypothetical protein